MRKKVKIYFFFISYDNINFYKYIRNTYIFNYRVQIKYILRYIYFIYLFNFLRNKFLGDKSLKDDFL